MDSINSTKLPGTPRSSLTTGQIILKNGSMVFCQGVFSQGRLRSKVLYMPERMVSRDGSSSSMMVHRTTFSLQSKTSKD